MRMRPIILFKRMPQPQSPRPHYFTHKLTRFTSWVRCGMSDGNVVGHMKQEPGIKQEVLEETHVKQEMFTCCEESINRLKKEMEVAQTDSLVNIETRTLDEKPFGCDLCGYSSKLKQSLQAHMIVHSENKPFRCPNCNYRCKVKGVLASHIKHFHSSVRPYSCPKCQFRSKTKGIMKTHMATHSEDLLSCLYCAHQCKSEKQLANHVDQFHSLARQFPCSKCQYRSKSKAGLSRHLTITHREGRPFTCPNCQLKFDKKSALKQHGLVHSQDKPFSCPKCPHKCKRRYALVIHDRHVHTSEKTFYCQQCDYRCKTGSMLKSHRIHAHHRG